MDIASLPVHDSWMPLLNTYQEKISQIFTELAGENLAPPQGQIFRALEIDLAQVRVVIFGQDPYPTLNVANGLAFSISKESRRHPPSLRNILRELGDDLGGAAPSSGDLSPWSSRGVLLLNRVLTTRVGVSDAHKKLGWQEITDAIAAELGRRGVIAILWGARAQELGKYFSDRIEYVHPSPLSAHRGFFGSRPFSQVNSILRERNEMEIDWSLT